MRANVKLFISGGLNEPRDVIATTLHALLADPEQEALAREDPENLARATEESLRWTSPIGMFPRVVHQDTELGGVELAAGTRIGVLIASANRDERHWEDPDRFDLRRATVRHMAFSRGPHVCPGAYVARQQVARAALPALLGLPGIRLATRDVPYRGLGLPRPRATRCHLGLTTARRAVVEVAPVDHDRHAARDDGPHRRPVAGRRADLQAPVERGDPVAQPAQAGAVAAGSAPPTPSSATSTTSVPSSQRRSTAACDRVRVARDVRDRLGDDEVRGGLDRRRQPLVRHGRDLDRQRHPLRERLQRRAQPAVGQHRRMDAARELAQLADRVVEVLRRAVEQLAGRLGSSSRRAARAAAGSARARRAAAARRRAGRARSCAAPRRRSRRSARARRAAPTRVARSSAVSRSFSSASAAAPPTACTSSGSSASDGSCRSIAIGRPSRSTGVQRGRVRGERRPRRRAASTHSPRSGSQ